MSIPRVFATVCVLLASQLANAADNAGHFAVLSNGTKSCGTVVFEHEKDDRGKLTNSIWVGGYLTAINAEVFRGFDISKGTDSDARSLWIYNYCKANPLDSLFDATYALVKELKRRAQ